MNEYSNLLQRAHEHATSYLADLSGRHVGGRASRADLIASLGGPLAAEPASPERVIEDLVEGVEPGLVASAGPRYFGFVTGGAHPVSLAADWLVSAWDQNGAMFVMSPAIAVIEEVTAAWILDLLGLPATASVGFVTGAHGANVTALAAARHEVLRRAGWDVEASGLQGAPHVHVVAGAEAHTSIFGAARMLGLGSQTILRAASDDQGGMRPDALADVLKRCDGPTIVCAQAGNVNTGASDPFDDIATLTASHGAWLHVDGAFGLWAAAARDLRPQVAGLARADSWTTDGHKWLNVPYDSGIVCVAHPAPHRAAMSMTAAYLARGTEEERNGMEWVPEASRRARVVPLYATLRTLGRRGVEDLVTRCRDHARRMADLLRGTSGVIILNEVVLNQVLVRFEARGRNVTPDVIARVQADGVCWAGGTSWQGQPAMRISISGWNTTEADIDMSGAAILRAFEHAAV